VSAMTHGFFVYTKMQQKLLKEDGIIYML